MALTTQVLEKYPLQLDARTLRLLLDDVNRQIRMYDSLVKRFEAQHGCDLKTFEDKVKRKELPEHPTWETAIEWGTAVDELEKLSLIRRALEWILNFLN
jgi:hypothetical protein